MTQIKLIFSVFGDLLDPDQFSQISQLSPTSFWFKGDAVPNRVSGLTRQETCWEYSLNFIPTLSLEEPFNLFFKKIAPTSQGISSYIDRYQLEAKIDIVVKIFDGISPGLTIRKDLMDLIVKMNGSIDIDLYYVS